MEVLTFGDVESALIAYLPAKTGAKLHDGLPDDRKGRFITVSRAGGTKANLVTDSANVMFECFAPDREQAHALAQLARAEVIALKNKTISGLLVYGVTEIAGPAHLPHPIEPNRYVFTVAISMRYTDRRP